MHRVQVVDSHTAGEPTRVVLAGGPDLGTGPLADRRAVFAREFDRFRSAVVNEPRGSDVLVGALLVPPESPEAAAGVVFFNNVGVLGMCGHATIGLAVTLAHLGKLSPGRHRFDTPVGPVTVELHGRTRATVENVRSYRQAAGVRVEVDGRPVTGDVAWGGNWFFLTDSPLSLRVENAESLTAYARRVKQALHAAGWTDIDHVELVGPPADPANHARNFVLCPGGAYDRSPCGTGTSAKLACLAAEGKLAPAAEWRQEGILGGVFVGRYTPTDGGVLPSVTGEAFVTAEATLLLDPADPLRDGVRP